MTGNYSKKKFFKYLGITAIFYIIFIIIGFVFIHTSLFSYTSRFIENIEQRIKDSLVYENGVWDTSLYNSDPFTSNPNASTTFPIYILTKDGYILDRSRAIAGFLDTSDYKHLIQFDKPQTINTFEKWRVLSRKLTYNNNELGVILIAYYNPDDEIIEKIDKRLESNINKIVDQLVLSENNIDISKFDERRIDYDLSFELVTKSNRVLFSTGRTPSFIDPSYVEAELNSKDFHIFVDNRTSEPFLVKSLGIKDKDQNIVGLISIGNSIKYIYDIENEFIKYSFIIGLILVPIITLITFNIFLRDLNQTLSKYHIVGSPKKKIRFNAKEGIIFIDDSEIPIVYNSNQYFMCKAFFQKPNKRWENDELVKFLGEDLDEASNKKIYDTAIAINKKIGFKLISYKDKTYEISSEYKNLVSSD